MAAVTSRVDLEPASVRRHLDTPVRQVVQREAAAPAPPRLEEHVATNLQQSTGWPLSFHGRSAGPLHTSLPLMARLLGGVPRVRLHTDAPAAAAAAAMGADAFTLGSDVFFAARQGDFSNPRGVALLGHELTHVVQQTGRAGGAPPTLEPAALTNERVIFRHLSGPQPLFPASTPLALAAPVQRAVASTPSAEDGTAPPALAAPSAAGLPTLTAAETAPNIDVARLADQVYDMLVRRLASERERRGW